MEVDGQASIEFDAEVPTGLAWPLPRRASVTVRGHISARDAEEGCTQFILELSESTWAIAANADATVLEVCLKPGALLLEWQHWMVTGPDYGTRFAGAFARRILGMQSEPLVAALERVLNDELSKGNLSIWHSKYE